MFSHPSEEDLNYFSTRSPCCGSTVTWPAPPVPAPLSLIPSARHRALGRAANYLNYSLTHVVPSDALCGNLCMWMWDAAVHKHTHTHTHTHTCSHKYSAEAEYRDTQPQLFIIHVMAGAHAQAHSHIVSRGPEGKQEMLNIKTHTYTHTHIHTHIVLNVKPPCLCTVLPGIHNTDTR